MKTGPAETKLLRQLKKYVKPGLKLLIACSGGADSIALADALQRLSGERGWRLAVMHVEHGIRGQEALRDAKFVKGFCAQRGLPFVCRHVQALSYAKQQGLSVEDAARRLRYAELYAYADANGCDYVVTAHQADDQAETVLLQLLRGSGTAGLGAMQIVSGRLLRPLLFVSRAEIEAYCAERGLSYCNDSTNDDAAYTRNRIRKKLLPLLERDFNPQVKTALGQTAILAQADNALAVDAAHKFFAAEVSAENALLCCRAQALQQAFAAVSLRVIRLMWEQKANGGELGFEHVQSVMRLLNAKRSGKMLALPGKAAALYSYGRLYIGAKQQVQAFIAGAGQNGFAAITFAPEQIKNAPQTVTLPDGQRLTLRYSETEVPKTNSTACYPWQLLNGAVAVRTRREGDRFYPYGGSGGKKLKDYFIDNKVPRAERDGKILIACGQNVLWITGGRQAGWKNPPQGAWLAMELEGSNNDA